MEIPHSAINPPNVVQFICDRSHDTDREQDLTDAAVAFRGAHVTEVARAFPSEK